MTKQMLWKLLLCLCTFEALAPSIFSQTGQTERAQEEKSFIDISPIQSSDLHSITPADIVSTRELLEPQISPDGNKIAFIVKQALLEQNKYRSALFIVHSDKSSKPTKLAEEPHVSQVRWVPTGDFITYLSTRSGSSQVWRINPDGGMPEQVTSHSSGVGQYEWSPDGSKIAFLTSAPESSSERVQAEQRGIVYDGNFSWLAIFNKSWIRRPQQLWVYDVRQQKEQRIMEWDSTIRHIAWSPEGQTIAFDYRPIEAAGMGGRVYIGLVSLSDRKFTPLITWNAINSNPRWSPDSKFIAFISDGENATTGSSILKSIFVLTLQNGRTVNITAHLKDKGIQNCWWGNDASKIFFELDDRSTSAIYEVPSRGGLARKVSQGDDHLSAITLNKDRSLAACIRQRSMMPPEVAVVDIGNGVPTTLTALNEEYKNIRLGEVTELKWKNKYGNQTNGFLIKPAGYRKGQRYPLLVILYGFNGTFISQAQWISSYPAQVFAANGFVVLMMNQPKFRGWRVGDFKQASFDLVYNPFASIEQAIKMLVDTGVADSTKKGIMGWSYGSFLTEYTITHSNLFEVASSGDGGGYSPVGYWLGNDGYRSDMDGIFGSDPYGTLSKNWREVSPPFSAQNLRIPLLIELMGNHVTALEFATAIRKRGAQPEVVLYPDEAHIFFQPQHRFYSMQRNVDWFNFWLLDKEDPDPAKDGQYTRWRAIRNVWQKTHLKSSE